MRIWSVHPQYLDTKGLVALWRETLLVKNVLSGNTRGYRHHPQLERFRAAVKPLEAVNRYLSDVYAEAILRGFRFDRSKFREVSSAIAIPVTDGQLAYEWQHLLGKLAVREPERFARQQKLRSVLPHPLFEVIVGEVAPWEKL